MNHKLYVARRENKMYQKDVAAKLGIHKQTYHEKEAGKKEFTVTEAVRLSIIFDCTLDDLFGKGARY